MNLRSAQHVLLCLRYGIGDVVMQTPALDMLRHALPATRITAFGARPAIELLENDPRVDELLCAQDSGLRHWGDVGTPEIKQAIRKWLGQEDFDVILDPSHAVIAVRDVLREQQTTILDTGKETQNEAPKCHLGGTAAIHDATLRAWGLAASGKPIPRLCLRAPELRFAEQFLSNNDLNRKPPVAISPVASSRLKRWPVERLAEVANYLIEENRRLLLFCGPQSDSTAELLNKTRHPHRIVSVGSIHLKQVAALFAHCAALVGNDTGLMHVAAAVGVPVVAVFGPTSPTLYLPPGATAVAGDIDCPYHKTKAFGPPDCVIANRCLIGDQSCINAVHILEVVKNVQAIIDPQSRHTARLKVTGCGGFNKAQFQSHTRSPEQTYR
jgi:ADP-heptose:LPS heptosyltransferase